MEVTKAIKVALDTLVDIANHSTNGQLVPVPDIAQRLHLSISYVESLLRPLRQSGLVTGVKGRTGGYQLLKNPRMIMIKDIVLAMNRIKKRKVEVSDIAKDLCQSLDVYMKNCISNVSLTLTIKDYIPSFSEVQNAPERKTYFSIESDSKPAPEKIAKGEVQKVVKTSFKKVEEIPRGPNSIFSFADYLNKISPTG